MLRFWWEYLRNALPLLRDAFKRGDLIASALAFLSGIAGLTWLLEAVPWWVPVIGLALLFVYGVARGVYDDFDKVKGEKDKLERKLEEKEKRKVVKELLGEALEEGQNLYKVVYTEDGEIKKPTKAGVEDWVDRTRNLIEAALDKAEAKRFASNHGYTEEELLGREPHPVFKPRFLNDEYLVKARLMRLDELMLKIHRLDINPDFDTQDWTA